MTQTATELLRESGNDWDVQLRDMFLSHDNSPVHIPDRFAITRMNTDGSVIPLGVSSKRYVPISPMKAFKVLDPLVSLYGIEFGDLRVVDNGAKIFITATMDMPFDVASGDTIIPKLIFRMRNDALGSLMMIACMYRMVCSNGLIVPISSYSVKIPHLGDNIDERINEWYDNLGSFSGVFSGIKESFKHLTTLPCDNVEQYAEMVFKYEGEGEISTRRQNLMDDITRRFVSEEPANTRWAAYNAVTGNIDHGRSERSDTDRSYASRIDGNFARKKREALLIALAGDLNASREVCVMTGNVRLKQLIDAQNPASN